MNDNLYSKVIKEALKVEFLVNSEKLFLICRRSLFCYDVGQGGGRGE